MRWRSCGLFRASGVLMVDDDVMAGGACTYFTQLDGPGLFG